MSSHTSWLRLMLYAAIWLAACSPAEVPATQVVVTINSDLAVGSQLTRVDVELFAVGVGGEPAESRSFVLAGEDPLEGQTQLPLSFGVRKGDRDRFQLVATGYGVRVPGRPEEPVIEQKVIVTFQDRTTLLLKMFLGASCFANLCDGTTTCYSEAADGVEPGTCGPIPLRGDLDAVRPGEEFDAWDDVDAGEDAGAPALDADTRDEDGAVPSDGRLPAADTSPGDGTTLAPDADTATDGSGAMQPDAALDAASDAASGCPAGYVPDQGGCADFNECAVSNGGCAQACANKNGGFTCSCGAGYRLNTDARGCDLLAWGPVVPLDRTDDSAASAQVVVDRYGGVIVVWNQMRADKSSVWSSYFNGTNWSEPEQISAGTDASLSHLAMNQTGDAVAVFQQDSGDGSYDLWARRFLVGQRWLAPSQLDATASQIQGVHAVIDAQGNVTVAWTRVAGGTGAVWTTRFDVVGNGWSSAGALSSGAGATALVPGPPRLAVDAAGIVWALWSQWQTSALSMWINRYVPGSGWGAGTPLSGSTGSGDFPALALPGTGDAVLVWTQTDQSTSSAFWSNCSSGLVCSQPALLASGAAGISLVVDTLGAVIASWGTSGGSRWARKLPGQAWQQPLPLATGRINAMAPLLLIDASNNLIALWPELEGEGPGSLWYARFVAGGAWSSPSLLQTVVAPPDGIAAGVDAQGRVVAVWGQHDGTRYDLLSRRLQ